MVGKLFCEGEVKPVWPVTYALPEASTAMSPGLLITPFLRPTSPQVAGIDKGRASGVQLGHKGISVSSISGLKGTYSSGEIRGTGIACEISVAGGINRYARAAVPATSAQVGRIHERGTGSVQLADKPIPKPAESSLEGAGGCGEIGGIGTARDIGIARPIDCYTLATVMIPSTQVGGVDQG